MVAQQLRFWVTEQEVRGSRPWTEKMPLWHAWARPLNLSPPGHGCFWKEFHCYIMYTWCIQPIIKMTFPTLDENFFNCSRCIAWLLRYSVLPCLPASLAINRNVRKGNMILILIKCLIHVWFYFPKEISQLLLNISSVLGLRKPVLDKHK